MLITLITIFNIDIKLFIINGYKLL